MTFGSGVLLSCQDSGREEEKVLVLVLDRTVPRVSLWTSEACSWAQTSCLVTAPSVQKWRTGQAAQTSASFPGHQILGEYRSRSLKQVKIPRAGHSLLVFCAHTDQLGVMLVRRFLRSGKLSAMGMRGTDVLNLLDVFLREVTT